MKRSRWARKNWTVTAPSAIWRSISTGTTSGTWWCSCTWTINTSSAETTTWNPRWFWATFLTHTLVTACTNRSSAYSGFNFVGFKVDFNLGVFHQFSPLPLPVDPIVRCGHSTACTSTFFRNGLYWSTPWKYRNKARGTWNSGCVLFCIEYLITDNQIVSALRNNIFHK